MTLQHLKNLSQKRIINMKRLYEEAGLSTSSMNSRLSLMNGSLSQEESRALELAVINQIDEIMLTLEIQHGKLANALEITEKDLNTGESVIPCGYLVGTNDRWPIYLPEDKLKRKDHQSGSSYPRYWQRDRIVEMLVKDSRLTATERGRALFTEEEEEAIKNQS